MVALRGVNHAGNHGPKPHPCAAAGLCLRVRAASHGTPRDRSCVCHPRMPVAAPTPPAAAHLLGVHARVL